MIEFIKIIFSGILGITFLAFVFTFPYFLGMFFNRMFDVKQPWHKDDLEYNYGSGLMVIMVIVLFFIIAVITKSFIWG